jgi:PIN domain nuclease of toxin-antitoxin system
VRLLADTCTFLWLAGNPARLSAAAKDALSDSANSIFLSVVSSWEIALKISSGGLEWVQDAKVRVPYWRDHWGIQSLALDEKSVWHLTQLPHVHRDPFDRMLVCQAIAHGLVLVTPDVAIRQYPVDVLW